MKRWILLAALAVTVHAVAQSDLIQSACRRTPSLKMCENVQLPPQEEEVVVEDSLVEWSNSNNVPMMEGIRLAGNVNRVRKNPFMQEDDPIEGSVSSKDGLRATNEKEEPVDGFISVADPSSPAGTTPAPAFVPSAPDENEQKEKITQHEDADLRTHDKANEEVTEEEGGGGGEMELERDEFGSTPHRHSLAEKEDTHDDDRGGVILFQGGKGEYCEKYEQHFSYYCVGEVDRSEKVLEVTSEFCPSYKRACPNSRATSMVPLTTWPEDPFRRPITTVSQQPEEKEMTSSEEEEEERKKRKQRRLRKLMKKFPCVPDCDARVFPHCTTECKCDYAYPAVQKFCNPPALPMFLNLCRLWYDGCPRYEQYHYASQFIYSKAEKGKVVIGPKPVNPYNIPQPDAVGSKRRALGTLLKTIARGTTDFSQPGRAKRSASPSREEDLVPWTVDEGSEEKKERVHAATTHTDNRQRATLRAGRSRSGEWSREPSGRRSRERSSRSREQRLSSREAALVVPPALPMQQEFRDSSPPRRSLSREAFEPMTRGDRRSSREYSSRERSQAVEATGGRGNARALAAGSSFPVFPSDASFGTNDQEGYKRFDSFTDSSGRMHRPRSRSPFTKPGLWEPNPDNPHNRDHANKWYYHPDSVTADWLNGQVNWGRHWAVPAVGIGGTDGYSTLHFPTIGTFLGIPDDYD